MNCMNNLIIEGNITEKPKLETLCNGTKLCSVNIAVSRTCKNSAGDFEEEVSYFDIITYGNMAEVCSANCEKGRGIRVVGRLRQEKWTDGNGKEHSKIVVVAEHIEFKPLIKKPEEDKA
ncbi:single-stranded DNA-binding protein [uncultured Treponema sp.]|uniref:single-stranded DNA-binding protein n=1 Tax=uncultured Treponema sp. TaxID=162155 RepID=UPI002598366F|nr:single-stranded DNA-binding protein [uncultured Treponema sp.]